MSNQSTNYNLVALVAFGKTSTERICRVLNSLFISYRIVLPNEVPNYQYSHVILSGSNKHVYENNSYPMPQWVLETDKPVLGICYGMQLIVHTFNGEVRRMNEKEHGPIEVTEIINNQQITNYRWMNRYDQIVSVSSQFYTTGVTYKDDVATITDGEKWWGVQYHPESSKYGDITVFQRFLAIIPKRNQHKSN